MRPDRLLFIDNIRIVVISLVVIHHLSMIYSALIPFYYLEPTINYIAVTVMMVFQLLNQSYIMGLLFFISGYFTPASFDRKGTRLYLRDRLIRLGVPLLIYCFVMNPLAAIGSNQYVVAIGPFWFVVMLIIFCLIYALFRQTKTIAAKISNPPKLSSIILFIIALAALSYLIRFVFPIGQTVFGFPSLYYLPQYISFFALGIVAYRKDWLRSISGKYGTAGFIAAMASLILLFIALNPMFGEVFAFSGGGTLQSGVFALWDSIFAVGICLWLITLFRKRFNFQWDICKTLSQSAFTVYLIHAPIIVMMAQLLRDMSVTPLLKFFIMCCICLPLCFALAYLIRKIPKADRIL